MTEITTWRIDTDEFKAGQWQFDAKRKEWFCECIELIEGRWEGFVSIRKAK